MQIFEKKNEEKEKNAAGKGESTAIGSPQKLPRKVTSRFHAEQETN